MDKSVGWGVCLGMQATVWNPGPRRRGADVAAEAQLMVGNVVDFDRFYRQEFAAMVALAHTICGDGQLAEDLAQEAMSKAHDRWHKVQHYDRPGAWLRRVTINLSLSRRRRLAREIVGLRTAEVAEPTPADPDDELWQAVATLAPKQRAAIALFYQDDLSTSEIAEILGCSVSTATSHLSVARKRLARLLGEPEPEPELGPEPDPPLHVVRGVER